jgi:soluble lytic murein transglycosylase-like protein
MIGRQRKFLYSAGLFLMALAAGAEADIYGYIDEQGTAHFSNIRQDKRYTLFMRTPRTVPQPKAEGRPKKERALAAAPTGPLRVRQQALSAQVASLAAALQVDAALVHAVITAESGYNPRARSDKGAMGLMQLMPETARRYCVKDPYDPVQNLRGGAQYLRDLLQRYDNDLKLAVAAYNAGEGAVDRHGRQVPPYRETRLYVPLVLGLYERYRKMPGLMKVAGAQGVAIQASGPRCG